jgi:hypothetical protein
MFLAQARFWFYRLIIQYSARIITPKNVLFHRKQWTKRSVDFSMGAFSKSSLSTKNLPTFANVTRPQYFCTACSCYTYESDNELVLVIKKPGKWISPFFYDRDIIIKKGGYSVRPRYNLLEFILIIWLKTKMYLQPPTSNFQLPHSWQTKIGIITYPPISHYDHSPLIRSTARRT